MRLWSNLRGAWFAEYPAAFIVLCFIDYYFKSSLLRNALPNRLTGCLHWLLNAKIMPLWFMLTFVQALCSLYVGFTVISFCTRAIRAKNWSLVNLMCPLNLSSLSMRCLFINILLASSLLVFCTNICVNHNYMSREQRLRPHHHPCLHLLVIITRV